MKKLQKLSALLLACAMVVLLFTACSGGSGGSAPSAEAKAEAETMNAINAERTDKLPNDPELKQEAKTFLDSAVDVNTGWLNVLNSVKIDRNNAGVYSIRVVVKVERVAKILDDIFGVVHAKDKNVDISAVGHWTKVGVAAKVVQGNTYVCVAIEVNPNA